MMEKDGNIVEVQDSQVNPWAENANPWSLEVTNIQEEPNITGEQPEAPEEEEQPIEQEANEDTRGEDQEPIEQEANEDTRGEDQEPIEDAEDPETGEEVQEEFEDEFAYHLAQQLKKDGYLLDQQEIGKDINMSSIYKNYLEANEDKLSREVDERVSTTLQSYGVSEENIYKLQAINNQTPIEELYEITKYEKYAQSELSDSEKDKAIVEMYKVREWSEEEIQDRLDSLELSDKKDEEAEKAQKFFGGIVSNYKDKQQQIAKEQAIQEQQLKEKNLQILEKALDSGEINSEKMSPNQRKLFKPAIYDRTEQVEVDGQVYPLTPFEKFIFEFSNDFSRQLEVFKLYHFRGQDLEVLKKEAEQEADENFLNQYRNIVKRDRLTSSITKKGSSNKGEYYEFETN